MADSPGGESFSTLLADAVHLAARRRDPDVVGELLELAMRPYPALGGIVVLLDDRGDLRLVARSRMSPEVLERFLDLGIASAVPVTDAVRFGDAVWLETGEERDRRYPVMRDGNAASVASASLPIVVTDRVIGALAIGIGNAHRFTSAERTHLEAFADLCGMALERARSEEAARHAEERNRWAVSTLSDQFRLVGVERDRAADDARRRQLGSILDAVAEGIAIVPLTNESAADPRHFVIEYANPAAGAALGTDRTAIMGTRLSDLPAGRALLDAASAVFDGQLASQLIVMPATAGRLECTITRYESGVVLLLRTIV